MRLSTAIRRWRCHNNNKMPILALSVGARVTQWDKCLSRSMFYTIWILRRYSPKSMLPSNQLFHHTHTNPFQSTIVPCDNQSFLNYRDNRKDTRTDRNMPLQMNFWLSYVLEWELEFTIIGSTFKFVLYRNKGIEILTLDKESKPLHKLVKRWKFDNGIDIS